METIPQAMPNMVRNVRSLCDHKVRKTSRIRSRKTMTQDWTRTRAERKRRAKDGTEAEGHLFMRLANVPPKLSFRGIHSVPAPRRPFASKQRLLTLMRDDGPTSGASTAL